MDRVMQAIAVTVIGLSLGFATGALWTMFWNAI